MKEKRLRPEMLSVKIDGNSIVDITQFSIHECFEFFNKLFLSEMQKVIATPIMREINSCLKFLDNVGVSYLISIVLRTHSQVVRHSELGLQLRLVLTLWECFMF